MSRLLTVIGLALVLVFGGVTFVVAQGDAGQEAEDVGGQSGACPSPGADLTATTGGTPEASPEGVQIGATPASTPDVTGDVATPQTLECATPGAGS